MALKLSKRRLALATWIALGTVQASLGVAQTQTTSTPTVGSPPTSPADVARSSSTTAADRLNEFESAVAKLEQDRKYDDLRIDAQAAYFDKVFNLFVLAGGIGSFLAGLAVFLAWLRSHLSETRHHDDYERERKFYEERAVGFERRQQEVHESALSLNAQQKQFGDRFLAQSEDMLSKQLDNIGKLGGVIEVVHRTFELELRGAEEMAEVTRQHREMDATMSAFKRHFRRQFAQVENLIAAFAKKTRVDWAHLNSLEITLATRALSLFESIPEFVMGELLSEEGGGNRYSIAHIYQLIGVSAFYTDNVEAASEYLHRALEIYGKDDAPVDHIDPQAFCSHFLGVLEKNWRNVDAPPGASLRSAQINLEDAVKRLQAKPGEFLTPATLAEVLTYSDGTLSQARQRLDDVIGRIERLKRNSSADSGQLYVLARAYLLRGNVEFLEGNKAAAREWYVKANSPQSAFAQLSLALSEDEGSQRRLDGFRVGLSMLEDPATGPMVRQDASGRITATAWAAVAAREVGDIELSCRYLDTLKSLRVRVHTVGRREPLFFCPVSKVFASLNEIIGTLEGQTVNIVS